jgi:hypothetical protein
MSKFATASSLVLCEGSAACKKTFGDCKWHRMDVVMISFPPKLSMVSRFEVVTACSVQRRRQGAILQHPEGLLWQYPHLHHETGSIEHFRL